MPYEWPVKTATFDFEEHPGLEVELRIAPVPVGELFEVLEYLEDPKQFASTAGIGKLPAYIDRYLVRWTLDGPAQDQPHELLFALLHAWAREVGGVPLPLPVRSSGIGGSREASPSPSPSTEPSSSTES